ncbi:MAG: carboxylesterase family protein [Flavobacteriales bacterium]|nr:carboxylesterase family protein [Flavobacteriales bacterium]
MRPTTTLVLLATASLLQAQDCSIDFLTPQFGVQQEMDLAYGTQERFNGQQEVLRLNLFKPVGDGQTERPLIVLVHGGGFFDGHRDDLNALCTDLAAQGWVAATVGYRLDFYGTWLLGSPWAYDPAEVIRAAYRAQQDVRGAVRYLKGRAAQDSSSTTNVYLLGFSAGAISALHAAFVDDPAEKPAACGAIGPVTHLFTNYPRPDLGPIEGTSSLNGQTEEVRGVVSFYGGLLDTNMVGPTLDKRLYLYHQTGDPIVGCYYQQGLHGMPLGVGDNFPYLYGSCVMNDRIENLQPDPGTYFYHQYTGNAHEVHDMNTVWPEAIAFMRDDFCPPPLLLDLHAVLEGPYDATTGLMDDDLRTLPDFPLMEPFSALGYLHQGGGGETVDPQVLGVTGPDAIVDWVLVELRDANDPTTVLASQSALLQRDGDVVATDGVSTLPLLLPEGNYHVAMRHRNHLGCMTAGPVLLGHTPTAIDLAAAGTLMYGSDARISVTGTFPAEALWAGDVSFDGVVKYTGVANDRDPILLSIGGVVPTGTTTGYSAADVDLNGVVKYTGAGNDRDRLLQSVGGVVPTATRVEQLP